MTVFVGLVGAGAIYGWKFWNTSPLLMVSEVKLNQQIPPGLQARLDIYPGQNIFLIRTGHLEKLFLKEFPELGQFKISRKWNREIHVKGVYRSPVAIVKSGDRLLGIDSKSIIFPIRSYNRPSDGLPQIINIKKL